MTHLKVTQGSSKDEELNPEGLGDLNKVTQALVTGAGWDLAAGRGPQAEYEPPLHPSKLWGLRDAPEAL